MTDSAPVPTPTSGAAGDPSARSDADLLRRAFGPDPVDLDHGDADRLSRLIAEASSHRSRLPTRVAETAESLGRDGDAAVDAAGSDVDPDPFGTAAPGDRRRLWPRLRAFLVGAGVAAVVGAVTITIWVLAQPRPVLTVQAVPVNSGDIEDILGLGEGFFASYTVVNPLTYGEVYGSRILGSRLASGRTDDLVDCLWFVPDRGEIVPVCAPANTRDDLPWLFDAWRDDDGFVWAGNRTPGAQQMRISILNGRLEIWNEPAGS